MAKMITPAVERAERARAKIKNTGSSISPTKAAWHRLLKNKAAMIAGAIILVFMIFAIFPAQIAPYGYDEQNYAVAFTPPSADYPLGTDNLGRCILSRIIWGSRMSLIIGIPSSMAGFRWRRC